MLNSALPHPDIASVSSHLILTSYPAQGVSVVGAHRLLVEEEWNLPYTAMALESLYLLEFSNV